MMPIDLIQTCIPDSDIVVVDAFEEWIDFGVDSECGTKHGDISSYHSVSGTGMFRSDGGVADTGGEVLAWTGNVNASVSSGVFV